MTNAFGFDAFKGILERRIDQLPDHRKPGRSLPPGLFPTLSMSVALTPPALGLPTAVLADFGLVCQSSLQMATTFGRITLGPGAFDENPARLSITGVGHGTLSALRTDGNRILVDIHADAECARLGHG
jgi:hypothetical protein